MPAILQDLANNYDQSHKHAATLFNLFLRLLHHFRLPPRGSTEDIELRPKLMLDDESGAKFIATWIGKLFLFNTNASNGRSCPGLGSEDCEFLQLYDKPETWSPSATNGLSLIETKVHAAKLLASGAFTDNERLIPALIASADVNSRISEIGEDMLKRALHKESTENLSLIQELYNLYLGSPSEHVLPAPVTLQIKVLSILSTSTIASTRSAEILQIVKKGLVTNQTTENAGPKGLVALKLNTQIFNLVSWIAKTSPEHVKAAVAPEAAGRFREYIDGQGWPTVTDELRNNASELQLRARGYETIGLLAQACPEKLLFEENLDLLRWFFQSLGGDASGKDISLSIEQGMAGVVNAFSRNRGEVGQSLVGLLSHYASLTVGEEDASGIIMQRSTRYMAVRFSNRCLSFSNVHGRLIALLALSGGETERREIIEEGRRGLDPYWYGILNPSSTQEAIQTPSPRSFEFPPIHDLVSTLLTTDHNQLLSKRVFGDGIVFCWTILLHEALESTGKSPVIDAEWQRNIEAVVGNDEEARAGVKKYLAAIDEGEPQQDKILTGISRAAFEDYTRRDSTLRPLSGKVILEIWQLGPEKLLDDPHTLSQGQDLKNTIFSSFQSARLLSGRIFGLMSSRRGFWSIANQEMVNDLFATASTWEKAVGSEVHRVHGSLVAVAHALSRAYGAAPLMARREEFLKLVFIVLKGSRDKDLIEAALLSISQLSLFGVIKPDTVKDIADLNEVVKIIEDMAKKGNENAIAALGNLAMQCLEDRDEKLIGSILSTLYGLHEVRQAETQFAVGAALSCLSVGWKSKALIGVFDITGSTSQSAPRSHTLQDVIEKVLENCKTTKPALRQASVVWLLCLIQYCGHEEEVVSRLRQCQTAFKGFLADKESLNQEVASKGLTLIYEKGDRELRDDLIKDLVTSFTSTKSNLSGNVSAETELFDTGALPTGEGQSVTTYKDIISLANEVGNPGLVYQFMSLASNSAIWSSRSAFGRFGLSRILSDASNDGYLAHNPKLYSSLFRYRFDPNANVRAAMNDIWNSLVKDPKSIIETYFENILQDLFKSILNKEWRTRQASCAALTDLLQSKPLQMYENHLTRIWELTFKVCDDIKGSVRLAAMTLARTLTTTLVHNLEAGTTSPNGAKGILEQVLPFLLGPSGLESAAQEVQSFSLVTIMDIVKKANAKVLRPFIADLIGRLLSMLTSIEPGVINYVYLNAEKYGVTEQEIDNARLSSVKMSPMMEAIERCLDMLDESVMPSLEAILTNANKTVIGLPSRVGLCRVMVSLATRHRALFQSYAGNFLKSLRRQVMDRNDTISTSAAVACGYLCRLAPDHDILAVVDHAKKTYFESEDDRHRTIAAEILLAIAKHATDRFAALSSDCLPFAYFGLHDINKASKDLFRAAWEENAGGSRAVLLYLHEIIALSMKHLDSPRWAIKFAASYTIADTVKTGTEIAGNDAAIIWPALDKAMSGKTWDGKEKVLEAFALFWKRSPLARSDPDIRRAMEKTIVREAKRTNVNYRVHALKALADMIEATATLDRTSPERAPKWVAITFPISSSVLEGYVGESGTGDGEDEMDIDAKTEGNLSSKDLVETIVANALRAMILSAAVSDESSTETSSSHLSQILVWLKRAISHPYFATRNNILFTTLLEACQLLFATLDKTARLASPGMEQMLIEISSLVLFTSAYSDLNEKLRNETATTASSLASAITGHGFSSLKNVLLDGATKLRSSERSQPVLSTWVKVEEVLKKDIQVQLS